MQEPAAGISLWILGERVECILSEIECDWTKTYVGARDVYYCGSREGKGIWGLGNCRVIQAASISGRSRKRRANANTKAKKSQMPVQAIAAHIA